MSEMEQLLGEFHANLVEFFRPFVSVRPVDWTCVRDSANHFAFFFEFKEFVDLYFDYIFGLFEDFRITDKAVIRFCVKKYCRFKLNYCGFRFPDPDGSHFPSDMEIVVPRYEYRLVPRYLEQLPGRPFLYRDPSTMERILRYVAPAIIEWKDLHNYITYVMFRIRIDPFVWEHVHRFHWKQRDGTGGSRRLKLTLMAIDFVLQLRTQNCEDPIKGLRLLFQAIPDHHVSSLEIFNFLMRRITFTPSKSKVSYIRKFLESFKKCYPESLQALKPRSLKHLARCEVRKCLGRAHTLPHGVWYLGLPRELEDYVLLQTWKDQFRPVIRPLSAERLFAPRPAPEIQFQERLGLGRS